MPKITKEKRLNYNLRHKYLWDSSIYDHVSMMQGGACAICNKEGSKLYVDHDHETTHPRGLLCQQCNTMLGMAKDNPDILRNAINYLSEHS